MSICLNVIGEHNFNIAQKTKEENAEQIIERLRNIEGLNEVFIYDQNNYSNDLLFVNWKNRESWSDKYSTFSLQQRSLSKLLNIT